MYVSVAKVLFWLVLLSLWLFVERFQMLLLFFVCVGGVFVVVAVGTVATAAAAAAAGSGFLVALAVFLPLFALLLLLLLLVVAPLFHARGVIA